MGEFSVDFTDDFSRLEQVLFQRGNVALDGELNEIGRLPRIMMKRMGMLEKMDRFKQQDDSEAVAARPVVKGLTFKTDGGSLTNIIVQASDNERAMVSCLGYVFELPTPTTLETEENSSGDPTWQQIYFTLKESEVDSGTLPAIKVNALGETAIRTRLEVKIKIGEPQAQAANDECTTKQPWEGGTRTGLLAVVRRGANTEGTQINPLRDIHEAWLDPQELREWQAAFFSPQIRLRCGIQVGGTSAAASWKANKLVIEELVVGIGFGAINEQREFMSVRFEGKHEIDLAVGQVLVLLVPSRKGNFDLWDFATSKNEFKAVLAGSGSVRPKPQEVEYVVLNSHTLQDTDKISANATRADADLYTRVPVCLRYQDPPTHGSGISWQVDVVFIDGKQITREDIDRPKDIPSQHQVRWAQGNAFHDWLPPEDSVPSNNNDKTPYFRGYAFPQEGSVKEVFAQCVRNLANDSTLDGTLIFVRKFVARGLSSSFESETLLYEGEITTYNASWDPANKEWKRDDPAEHSTMQLNGVQRKSFSNLVHSVMGMATHDQGKPDTWNNVNWDNGEQTSSCHLYFQGRSSNLILGSGNNDYIEIRTPHRIAFSNQDQPIRSLTGSHFPTKHTFYDAMAVRAYGSFFSTAGVPPTVILSNGSMNLASAVYGLSGDDGFVEVTMNSSMADQSYTVVAMMIESQYGGGLSVDNRFPIQIAHCKPVSPTSFRIKLATQYPAYTGGASGDVSQGLWEDFDIRIQMIVFGDQ